MQVRALFFFVNGGSKSCFLTLITTVGLSTITSMNCGELKGCSFFCRGGGADFFTGEGARWMKGRFSLFEPKVSRYWWSWRYLNSQHYSRTTFLFSFMINFFLLHFAPLDMSDSCPFSLYFQKRECSNVEFPTAKEEFPMNDICLLNNCRFW